MAYFGNCSDKYQYNFKYMAYFINCTSFVHNKYNFYSDNLYQKINYFLLFSSHSLKFSLNIKAQGVTIKVSKVANNNPKTIAVDI